MAKKTKKSLASRIKQIQKRMRKYCPKGGGYPGEGVMGGKKNKRCRKAWNEYFKLRKGHGYD